jgi:hypothetical protein
MGLYNRLIPTSTSHRRCIHLAQNIVESVLASQPYTYLLSFPALKETICENIKYRKKEIERSCSGKGKVSKPQCASMHEMYHNMSEVRSLEAQWWKAHGLGERAEERLFWILL